MRWRRAAGVAALAVACVAGTTTATAAAAQAAQAAQAAPGSPAAVAATPESEFVGMMIPHHHQARVMSQMVPARSSNASVRAMAGRIESEQRIEILVLQGWQRSHGLPVTDPVSSYEAMLDMPEMLEHMGMATREELAELSALGGTAFDVRFLQLMIEHHHGAVHMLTDVLSVSTDEYLQQVATDMLVSQYTQILQMEEILEGIT
jgi:uncharacterized protein (DUF305 family)